MHLEPKVVAKYRRYSTFKGRVQHGQFRESTNEIRGNKSRNRREKGNLDKKKRRKEEENNKRPSTAQTISGK